MTTLSHTGPAGVVPPTGPLPGFGDPVQDAQGVFRAVLDAMARPGTIHDLALGIEAPAPLSAGSAAVLMALADFETPVWLDGAAESAEAAAHLRFHCGCPLASGPADAVFAVVADPALMPPLSAFAAGTEEYPDRSCTVIVQVASLAAGAGWVLTGPGIRDRASLRVGGLPPAFAGWVRDNHAGFPLGVDLVFTCGGRIAALPRSTRIGE